MALVIIPTFDTVHEIEEAAICNKSLWRIGAETIKDTTEDTKQSRICKSVYSQTRDELLRMYPFNFSTKTVYIPQDAAFASPMNQYSYAFMAENHITITGVSTEGSAVITGVAGITDYAAIIGRSVMGVGIPVNARIQAADGALNAITMDRVTTDDGNDFTVYLPILKILEVAANPETLFESIGGGASRRILCNMISNIVNTVNVLELKYVEQVIDPGKFDSMFTDALAIRIASKIAVTLSKDANLSMALQQEFAAIMQLAKNATAEEKQIDSPDPWWTDRQTIGTIPQARR